MGGSCVLSPAVVEAVLPHAVEGSRWIEATEVLASCGMRDERIVQRILVLLAEAPGPGAEAARSYGDETLVPSLQATFDAALPDGEPTREPVDVLIGLRTHRSAQPKGSIYRIARPQQVPRRSAGLSCCSVAAA